MALMLKTSSIYPHLILIQYQHVIDIWTDTGPHHAMQTHCTCTRIMQNKQLTMPQSTRSYTNMLAIKYQHIIHWIKKAAYSVNGTILVCGTQVSMCCMQLMKFTTSTKMVLFSCHTFSIKEGCIQKYKCFQILLINEGKLVDLAHYISSQWYIQLLERRQVSKCSKQRYKIDVLFKCRFYN